MVAAEIVKIDRFTKQRSRTLLQQSHGLGGSSEFMQTKGPMNVADGQFRTVGPQSLAGRQCLRPPPHAHKNKNPQLCHVFVPALLPRHPLQFGEGLFRHTQLEIALGGIDVVLQGDDRS